MYMIVMLDIAKNYFFFIQNKVVYDADGNLCLVPMELRKQLSEMNIQSGI